MAPPPSAPPLPAPAGDRQRRRPLVLAPLLAAVLALALLWLPAASQALDTSAGVGLQERALFQDTVDYTLTNQSGNDFSGQQLANASFAGATGKGTNFAGANLHGAILTQGAFPDADFSGADLSEALLDRVDLSGTDLRGAVLSGAIATGANFSGARIEAADFSGALLDRFDQRQLCQRASGTNPITGADTRTSLEC